ncbi:TPA: GNAT family N-acetyltransferase [Legionella pneumophila]|uniref:N-acetyltransferase n=2 Tax=Legionella pneumophila TaxID=446 RepID=A0A3A6VQU3_LEGPN|nr:GNAT family N-acetyltransferase [Legionella pneumophila]ERH41511.1 N-acetyltransferase GCN5 [Legionella pneumophila str. Leg01/53]ERH44203.1 N-acetyltransferase GCN5 [Legionella pneumophila str. Leg01/11]ERI47042.1 N-acetyltransferase GCN5 [Legionella pneumophila str. Leg01/20]ANN96323.1 GCN5 family acetyltransferase [Legionella pneumophila]ERB41737.1 N-acetyltransferase GCN5 [Legionella pneumophila str. 121004]
MLLFSSALAKHKLTFTRLSDCMEYLPLAAKWAEDEWGYIRNKGVEYREGVMHALSHDLYIGTYAGQPVAMFALLEHELPSSRELMYVYVDKEYRGLGFGKQIIEEAKRLTAMAGSDLILLDTLKPSLNRLYEKHGAKVVCEGKLYSHPTDVLSMTI